MSAPEGLIAVGGAGRFIYALGYFQHVLYQLRPPGSWRAGGREIKHAARMIAAAVSCQKSWRAAGVSRLMKHGESPILISGLTPTARQDFWPDTRRHCRCGVRMVGIE